MLHTTGSSNLKDILNFYHDVDGYQPHYLIAYDGSIYRIVNEKYVAYHAKIEEHEAKLYSLGFVEWSSWVYSNGNYICKNSFYPGYVEWKKRWYDRFQSPLDLVTGSSPNRRSIGVEIQQTVYPMPLQIFTDAQYQACAELVNDICARNRIVVSKDTVVSHSDLSPMRRCTARGPWDLPTPGFGWERLFQLISEINNPLPGVA